MLTSQIEFHMISHAQQKTGNAQGRQDKAVQDCNHLVSSSFRAAHRHLFRNFEEGQAG